MVVCKTLNMRFITPYLPYHSSLLGFSFTFYYFTFTVVAFSDLLPNIFLETTFLSFSFFFFLSSHALVLYNVSGPMLNVGDTRRNTTQYSPLRT